MGQLYKKFLLLYWTQWFIKSMKTFNRDLPVCSAVPKDNCASENLKQPNLKTSGVDGRALLKLYLQRKYRRMCVRFVCLSGRTMALESTQPLTEMSTRNISCWVKAAGAKGWPYHLHVPSWNVGASTSRSPQDLYRDFLPLPFPLQKCIRFTCLSHVQNSHSSPFFINPVQ